MIPLKLLKRHYYFSTDKLGILQSKSVKNPTDPYAQSDFYKVNSSPKDINLLGIISKKEIL